MKKITRKNLEKFLEQHKTDVLILDIGAGKVKTNHSYTKYFPNRLTVDVDSKREPDVVGDIHALPFQNESHEFLVCTEVLEHCHTPQKAVDEMKRILKPGGKLILTTRFVYPLHDVPHDYYRFTKYGLESLMKAWSHVEITPETDTFSAIGALLQRIGFQTKLRGGKITKLCIYIFAYIFEKLDFLLLKEYGDIQKETPDDHIMTTGYYVIAIK